MSVNPDKYNSQSPSILNLTTPYNGRVNIIEPENPDARFQMYEKIAVKNKSTEYRNALHGDFECTPLSEAFFSAANVQIIQNGLRAGVYEMSGDKQLVIAPQNVDVLKTIMRHMFIQYANFEPTNIAGQIKRLNQTVLEYAVPNVYSESIGYLKYLQDQSSLVVPLELPQQTDRVFKQLELKPWY
jgi:hypothetical protein